MIGELAETDGAGIREPSLRREDLDYLGTVVQLEMDAGGILRVADPQPPFDEDEGARREGTTVQLGLTKAEIDEVWDRIEGVIENVDDGTIPVF